MKQRQKKGLRIYLSGLSLLLMATIVLFACSKSNSSVAPPYVPGGQDVQPGNISGPIKGTMQSNQTYFVTGDVTVNRGDSLIIQPGVNVYFKGAYNFWIKGNLFSLGSSSSPVSFTVQGQAKQDQPGTPIATDPAYQGIWGGFWADTSCPNLVLKWTKIEFAGAPISAAQPPIVGASTGDSYNIFFQNTNGNFILEDSWVYGATDDCIRLKSGRFSVMRNTFEKAGPTGGDCFNVKGGGVGDCAYNLFIGCASNGPKASDIGQPGNVQTNCNYYNNTIVNGGYKNVELGRGGSINYEQQARGMVYNNLIVNCRFGLRIIGATQSYLGNSLVVADTANMHYGYTYNYNDSVAGVDQFYPVTPDTSASGAGGVPVSGLWTGPQATDIPDIISLVPSGYYPGAPYNTTAVNALAGQNNPMFKNFPLPEAATPSSIAYASGFDFHLQSGSPAIGKGYTSFAAIASVPLGGVYGANITQPGSDIGAYQSDGSGNQH
ncbi:MAG TPA: hypothetical protein DIC22_04300 [Chitinophagaceae bacterium]|jgi:hypothetical protein|nr:hypothetical protein [Chitinophagaceae bacterium]